MSKKLRKYRHGDVIIVEAEDTKDTTNLTERKEKVLAYGEVTGHAHRIKQENGDVAIFEEKNGQLFFQVKSDKATITHEEHKPLELDKGNYHVYIQKEYDEFEEERRVRD